MNTEIATAIVVGIATIGLVVWLFAIKVMLRRHSSSARPCRTRPPGFAPPRT